MSKIKTYIQESSDELVNKTSWPTWKELQNSSMVVAVASIIITIMIYLMDLLFSNGLTGFYSLFS